MNKHIIYIPNNGQEYLLGQQLAHAFAKHNYDAHGDSSPTIIAQYGSNLKPLELVNPTDTLQVMFTPISNIHAPMHTQTSTTELLNNVPMLAQHLLQDGLHLNGCTIQLYTLEYAGQNNAVLHQIARALIEHNNFSNFTLEWHVIPRLKELSNEQIHKIFQPDVTCQWTIHASHMPDGTVNLKEFSGVYFRSDQVH